jgi:hypothetical protein
MNIGMKIGLAALGGAAIGTAIGFVGDEPNTAAGAAMTAAGAGTMSVFGLALRNPGPFTSTPAGLLGVGIGALWAGMGVTTLLRSGHDSPVKRQYNPADHIDEQASYPVNWELPKTEPNWELPDIKPSDYDPLRSGD